MALAYLTAICKDLEVWNDWIHSVQHEAGEKELSSWFALQPTSSDVSPLIKGDGLLHSVVMSIDRLANHVKKDEAREEYTPLVVANSVAKGVATHLSVAWQNIKDEVPSVRRQNQTNGTALLTFNTSFKGFEAWMKEQQTAMDALKIDSPKFEVSLFEVAMSACETFPSAEELPDLLNTCLKAKETRCSVAASLCNAIKVIG